MSRPDEKKCKSEVAEFNAPRAAAAEYRAAGFEPVRIDPGEKRPWYLGWSVTSTDLDTFEPDHGVGLRTGWASNGGLPGHHLLCVDVDDRDAIATVREELPHSGMVDGRPGKPGSHLWFLVPAESIPPGRTINTNCDAELAARARGIHPGAAKMTCKRDGVVLFEVLATGQQAAVPPSLHPSGERREWEGGPRGEPAVVPFPDLLAALERAAAKLGTTLAGGKPKAAAPRAALPAAGRPQPATPRAGDSLDDHPNAGLWQPHSGMEVVEAEHRYAGILATVRNAGDLPRTGQCGDAKTFRLLATGLDTRVRPERVLALFQEQINGPLTELKDAWTEAELRRKLEILLGRGPDPARLAHFDAGGPVGAADADDDALGVDNPRTWDNPGRIAEAFLKEHTIVRVKKTVWKYDGRAWAPASDGGVKADVHRFTEAAAAEEFQRLNDTCDAEQAVADLKVVELRAKLGAATQEELVEHYTGLLSAAEREAEGVAAKRPKVEPRVGRNLVEDVMAAVFARVTKPDDTKPGVWFDGSTRECVAVENGLLDLNRLELIPHTPDWFGVWALPVAYDRAAPKPAKFLAVVGELMQGDAERVALLQELFGFCLDPWSNQKAFFALVGDGENGKSVVLTVLRAMLGSRNCSAVTLDAMLTNRFAAFGLLGKLANIVGDQGAFDSRDEGVLKCLTGGDEVAFEQKGKDTLFARNTAKIVFACNTLPTIADKSDATWNRLKVVPFEYKVPAAQKDPGLLREETWWTELPGILNWALEGLKRQRANKGFTNAKKCAEAVAAHRLTSDPAAAFLEEHYVAGSAEEFVTSAEVYRAYVTWCDANGNKYKQTSQHFGRAVRRVFPGVTDGQRRVDDGTGKRVNAKAWIGLTRWAERA